LRADLQEVGRAAAVGEHEGTHQALAARLTEYPAEHREAADDEAVERVEEQLLVHRHALAGDARQRRHGLRIADMCGEGRLEVGAHRPPSSCSRRICATSAYSSASGGKLKSRSSRVGRTPCSA